LLIAQSPFGINSAMGKLTALTLALGTLFELSFMPSLLITLDGLKSKAPSSSSSVLGAKAPVAP
jgi:hypothetical protein